LAPRAYDNQARQQRQADLKTRIAVAASQLHAGKGVLATSYAEIAEHAGVSVPTVYKHYPDLDQLVRGCSGHVARGAPAIPAEAILACPALAPAIEKLVEAMDRRHAYFEPWMVWREHSRISALAEGAAAGREQLTKLCGAVLTRHRVAGNQRELAAQWEALLHFELWHRLVRVHKLRRATVCRTLIHLLLAAAGQQSAAPAHSRPTSRRNS
jgi:AcrR family transcriptional regulator